MSKHTPGPWFDHGQDGLFDTRTHGPSIQDASGNVICAVEAVDADLPDEVNEERMANARLIAAAPETAERLDAVLEDLNTIIDHARAWPAEKIIAHAMGVQQQIARTLAKARGE